MHHCLSEVMPDFNNNSSTEELDLQNSLIYQVLLYLDLLGMVLTSGLLHSGLGISVLATVPMSPSEGSPGALFSRIAASPASLGEPSRDH